MWQSASKTTSVRNWTRNVIIAKTEKSELTQWFSSFVYRRKQNGRLRLHLNAKDLNTAIHIEHHVTLTLEEILLNLKDAKVFSIREKKSEYRNVFPGKESINLSTFERYRFRHMPFSLKKSQEVSRLRWTKHFFLVTQTAKQLNSSPGTGPQCYEFECLKDNYSARRDVGLTQGSLIPKEHSLYRAWT